MRIAIHTQHFAGVGHHMRASTLARTLRQPGHGGHQVVMFDGGVPFRGAPGEGADAGARVQLPAVAWGDTGLAGCEPGSTLATILADRRRLFTEGLACLRPDVLLVDSFPFGRWVFRDEILAGIRAVRSGGRHAQVVCSLRDIPRAPDDDTAAARAGEPPQVRTWVSRPGDDGQAEVPPFLDRHFDAILVHGDPRVRRLEESFPWVTSLRIPVHYTGYVQQERHPERSFAGALTGGPLVVVSVGGGSAGLELIGLAAAAWQLLKRQSRWAAARMIVFGGALMEAPQLARAAAACRDHGVDFRPFSSDFPDWLGMASLSISRGGYNTAVALLAARVPAVVLPGRAVSDQALRTRRLAEMGLVVTSPEAERDPAALAALADATLGRPRPVHDLDLAGASRTARLLEMLRSGATRDLAPA